VDRCTFCMKRTDAKFDIQNVWFSYTVYYIDFQNLYYCVICIFHSTRMNLRAMILRSSAGLVLSLCVLRSLVVLFWYSKYTIRYSIFKNWMHFLQFSKSILLCYLYISFHACESTSNDTKEFSWKGLPSWKCEISVFPTELFLYSYKCGGYVPCCVTVNAHAIVISTRVNLRAMILRSSAERVCHLKNLKLYMSYLQQCTKIIKIRPLVTEYALTVKLVGGTFHPLV
jgi:hypothetical protein